MSDPDHSSHPGHPAPVVLTGNALTIEDLVRVARDPRVQVEIPEEALARARKTEDLVRACQESDVPEYGVTTGFGEFKNVTIRGDMVGQLQENLLKSHCIGLGETADVHHAGNYFDAEVVRAALVIRLNAFLKGYSGVRRELVEAVRAMVNRGIVPRVPIRGSVGSSGDLCPLSHLFVVLLGEGDYTVVREPGDLTAAPRELRSGLDQLAADLGMPVPRPSAKEGLALINGATFSAALLALAVHDAGKAAHVADVACALSLEAVCGCARAFDPRVHEARGHAGQIACAANLRALLKGSKLIEAAGAVQDVYSLRCAPAVHGAARDVIAYARRAVEAEINAATDNPLFFPADGGDPWDYEFRDNWPEGYSGERRVSYSAGNFHGEPVGMAADCLAIGLAELADISERRIQMLLDKHHNRGLPASLVPMRGVNSGYMIAQYAAAGVVSENKVLTHPASVDSIPTSANSEDHNAMSTIACRKLRTVLRNVQAVLAIELLVAAQAVEWRVAMKLPPKDGVHTLRDWQEAEREAQELADRTAPEKRSDIAARLGEGTGRAYLRIRELAPPLLTDRYLETEVRAVRGAVEGGWE